MWRSHILLPPFMCLQLIILSLYITPWFSLLTRLPPPTFFSLFLSFLSIGLWELYVQYRWRDLISLLCTLPLDSYCPGPWGAQLVWLCVLMSETLSVLHVPLCSWYDSSVFSQLHAAGIWPAPLALSSRPTTLTHIPTARTVIGSYLSTLTMSCHWHSSGKYIAYYFFVEFCGTVSSKLEL